MSALPNPAPAAADEKTLSAIIQDLDRDATRLKEALRSQAGQQIGAASDSVAQRLGQLHNGVDLLKENAWQRAQRAGRAADSAVQQRPYLTAGIAAGAGLLLGALLARR